MSKLANATIDEVRSLSMDSLLLRKCVLEAQIESGKQSAYISIITGIVITSSTYFIKEVVPTWGIFSTSSITNLGGMVLCAIGISVSFLFTYIVREVSRDVLELKFVEKRIADLEKIKQKREVRLEQRYRKKWASTVFLHQNSSAPHTKPSANTAHKIPIIIA